MSALKTVENYFQKHFNWDADEKFIKNLQSQLQLTKKEPFNVPTFTNYNCLANWRASEKIAFNDENFVTHRQFAIPSKLCRNYESLMLKRDDIEAVALSNDLYNIVGRYIDVSFAAKDFSYTELFCMHALSHVMQTRSLVISNKQTLESLKEKNALTDEQIEKCRDQGLARPKVLILSPFRKHAFKIVQVLIKLMFGDDDRPFVSNLTKFKNEFSDEENRVHEKRNVASDYKEMMSGNIDDCFRVGIGLAKKSLKLYTKFEESDILLCSPVGLRMIIGDEEVGSKREFDFLASIEVFIIDKAHILFMQNWEHLFNIFETLNVIPKKISTDISRVRHWSLQDYSRYYRQTLIFSEVNFVEMHALMSRFCQNYAGEVSIIANQNSLVPQIERPIMQGMYRFNADDPQKQTDDRFDFFVANVLPGCDAHTLIFVSSYFDFVRLRNHLKKENADFAQVHEYAKKGKIAKARHMFFNEQRRIMLFTERFHFYFRYYIKGIKSIVFYQLPLNPNFYTELINFAHPLKNEPTQSFKVKTKILFSKFDVVRLQNIFGNSMAKRLIKSEERFYAMVGE